MKKKFIPALLVCSLGTGCTVGESVNVEADPDSVVTVTSEGRRRIVSVDAEALAAVLATDERFRADVVAALTTALDPRLGTLESALNQLQSDVHEDRTSISMNGSAIAGIISDVADYGTAIDMNRDQVMSNRSDIDANTASVEGHETRIQALENRGALGVRLTRDTGFLVQERVITRIPFTAVAYNSLNATTNNSEIVVPSTGLYWVQGRVTIGGTNNSRRRHFIRLTINSNDVLTSQLGLPADQFALGETLEVGDVLQLQANDRLEVRVNTTRTGGAELSTTDLHSFTVIRLDTP